MMGEQAILPPATLGMLGGGQLGRMFTVAARTMGYSVIVLDPDAGSPAGNLASRHLCADYLDPDALEELATHCAAVTTEFENVPAEALDMLAGRCAVRPGANSVRPTQDRLEEKTFLERHGLPSVAWAPVRASGDFVAATTITGVPALLKSARGGYDGKGQVRVEEAAALGDAFAELGGRPAVLERRIQLARELSVIVCRDAEGRVNCYPPAENVHRDGILFSTRVPAAIDSALAARARQVSLDTAAALRFVGVLAVELFVTDGGDVLVNEIAPRPHNSGHYTLDACATSQFEQQVRLVCGLPAGPPDLLSAVAMVNLLGDLWQRGEPDWSCVLGEPGACLHLYGKQQARPGRKMGHVNVLAGDGETALNRARSIHDCLSRPLSGA